jgi:23S rRNA pseudouridine955/2504/2580 synthase
MGTQLHVVGQDEGGQRIDRWFKKRFPGLSQGAVEKLLRTGQIRLDGARIKANARLAAGQKIRVPPLGETVSSPAKATSRRNKANAKEDRAFLESLILHRDPHVLVLNKPAGLAVQGGTQTRRHIDGMLDVWADESCERPRLVHRLDRDTSGVLVLAQSQTAASFLTAAFRRQETLKLYWAVCVGVPKSWRGVIDLPLVKGRGEQGREKMFVCSPKEADQNDTARRAVTQYTMIARAGKKLSLLALSPLTGRTHQLRVHMAAIGTPILGDGKYGGAAAYIEGNMPRQLHLHAYRISFPHPDGMLLTVTAPLPPHMKTTFELCGFDVREAEKSLPGPE